MKRIALVGGTGARVLCPGDARRLPPVTTAWGAPSAAIARWTRGGTEVFYLPRHGDDASLAPHRINYRANVAALGELAPDAVIAINAVGGITAATHPGRVVLPAQLIDYTSGRETSFFDGTREPLRHVEFDPPFSEPLRRSLAKSARDAGVDALDGGTYGVTQGPRLETAAEIDRLARDGCDVVGMTAMPEAALAREAGLEYAICAVSVNRAAGRLPPGASIHADIGASLASGMAAIARLLDAFLQA